MILVELRENEGVEEKEMRYIEWHTNESLKQLNVKLELVFFFINSKNETVSLKFYLLEQQQQQQQKSPFIIFLRFCAIRLKFVSVL